MNVVRMVWEFIKLTRPLFLAGGVLLYCLGVLVALRQGAQLHLGHLLTGQLLVTSIQLMTHYTNEYYDQEADRLNPNRTWFSGGSGVLASGVLSARVAKTAMIILASAAGILLVITALRSPMAGLYGLVALLAAWSYSGPPFVLVSRGAGELVASFIVALLVPMVGYTMQIGKPAGPELLITCLPLVLLHFAMLIAFQIPDREADEAVGKRTVAVRLGTQGAVRLHNLSLFLAFCVILGLTLAHWPGARWSWLSLPLAAWQMVYVGRSVIHPPGRFLWLTMGALALFALTSALWLVGLLMV